MSVRDSVLDTVLADLAAEGDQLRTAVAGLDDAAWARAVPAEGWTIATTIAHLAWTDEVAVLAAGAHTVEGKEQWDEVVLRAIADPTGFVDQEALALAETPPAELLARWDVARARLVDALRAVPAGQRMPWFGPPMSPTSMATARFMETWAHALDVYDAVVSTGSTDERSSSGGRPPVTDRIKHVAHLGVRTRDFSFSQHGLAPPGEEFRVELTAPSGDRWTWGPPEAAQGVRGTAYDFCQLVTQRIHRDDTDLVSIGADAETWLTIAQAFAGPAGGGRVSARSTGSGTASANSEGR